MKQIKVLQLSSNHATKTTLSKTQFSSVKVLSNLGLVRYFQHRNAGSNGQVSIIRTLSNSNVLGFVKTSSMSYGQISGLRVNAGVVVYLFSTEKGVLTQLDCMKHRIGGQMFARLYS